MDTTCSSCRRAISGSNVLYSLDAAVLCPECHAKDDIERTDKRAAENIRKSGYSAIALALISWLVNPFFILTVMALSAAGYTISSFRADNQRFHKHVEKSRVAILACAYIGIAVALLPISLRLLGVVLTVSP